MAHVKGLHEARGLPVGNLAPPKDQHNGKLTAKLARLDHHRGLLERQLAVWTEKQRLTRSRLILLEKEIAELERLIRQSREADRGVNRRKRARKTDRGYGGTVPRHDFSVEY
ncbi:MAG: hypothetical protein M5U16_15585 [Hyphomicrobium sp.]|nr:hypothetical protein [Hyphomicrobium sp.]